MHSGNTLSFFRHPISSRTLLILPSRREEKGKNGDRSLYKGKFSCQYPSCPWECGGFCVLVSSCHRLQLIIRQAKQLQPSPLPNRDSINALAFQKQIHPIIGKDICQLFRSLIRLNQIKSLYTRDWEAQPTIPLVTVLMTQNSLRGVQWPIRQFTAYTFYQL